MNILISMLVKPDALLVNPAFGAFAIARIVLAAVFVAAVLYLALKVGSYYDAAKKKL